MAPVQARHLPIARSLLLAFLAFGFLLRLGGGCEAMMPAAALSPPSAHQSHCADGPVTPDKPAKADASRCMLCAALPELLWPRDDAAQHVALEPIAHRPAALAGVLRGPALPPPRIA